MRCPARSASKLARILSLLVLVGSIPGCRRRSEGARPPASPPVPLVLSLVDLQIAPIESGDGSAIDGAALKTIIRRRLEAAGLVAPAASTGDDAAAADDSSANLRPARLRVLGRVLVDFVEAEGKGEARSSIVLRLDTRPSDAPRAINEELSATGEHVFVLGSGEDRTALAQSLAERTLGDLLGGFLARAHLQVASAQELHALIRRPDPLREEAVRQVGARQMRDEVPYLLTLLHDDTESIRDAALGALLALHEPRAVHELTHSRSLQDRRELRKILDAIATLGGDEARDYLNFVAEGHTDEEIRTIAAEARDRLERRRDGGPEDRGLTPRP